MIIGYSRYGHFSRFPMLTIETVDARISDDDKLLLRTDSRSRFYHHDIQLNMAAIYTSRQFCPHASNCERELTLQNLTRSSHSWSVQRVKLKLEFESTLSIRKTSCRQLRGILLVPAGIPSSLTTCNWKLSRNRHLFLLWYAPRRSRQFVGGHLKLRHLARCHMLICSLLSIESTKFTQCQLLKGSRLGAT